MPEKLLSSPPSMKPLLFKLNVFGVMKVSLLGAIFSFMFIDLFDSLSVLMFTYKEVPFRNEEERKKQLLNMKSYFIKIGVRCMEDKYTVKEIKQNLYCHMIMIVYGLLNS